MVRCSLCGREISDPTKCIVYEGYDFDKESCLYIFKKLRYIYETAIVDIIESWKRNIGKLDIMIFKVLLISAQFKNNNLDVTNYKYC